MTIIVICYVAVDGIAFVATFYKSYFSLILSQLLPESNPLTLGSQLVFHYSPGYLFCQRFPQADLQKASLLFPFSRDAGIAGPGSCTTLDGLARIKEGVE